jgi:tetratricopeptide (TPR) repeat protein
MFYHGLKAALFSAAFGGVAAALLAAPAAAQTESEAQGRAKAITIVVGAPASVNCAAAAGIGRFDDEALAFCHRAIESERLNRANRIVTRINRGAIHLRRGANIPGAKITEGELALADFDFVIAADPRNADAHLNRGAALVMVGRAGLAVGAITEALGLGVKQPHKAYLNRGAARETLGDLRGALEDYTTALEINPEWAIAEAELARFARTNRDRLAERVSEAGAPRASTVRAE